MAVFAALFGLLAGVRATRTEEDSGRADRILTGTVGRPRAFLAQLVAIGLGGAVLWLALLLSFLAGRLPLGVSAYLALAIVSVLPVFAGVGAVTSQLAPTRRTATGLATAVLVIAFALRTVAALPSAGRAGSAGRRRSGGRRSCVRSQTHSRSSSCSPQSRRRSCSVRRTRSSSGATSGAGSFPHATRHSRSCDCWARRPARRFARSAEAWSPGSPVSGRSRS